MKHFDPIRNRASSSTVLDGYLEALKKVPYGVRAPYFSDRKAIKQLEESLAIVYEMVGAQETDHLQLFTSEEEAAHYLFSQIYFTEMMTSGKNFIATIETEGKAIQEPLKLLENGGATILQLPVTSDGHITKEILEAHYSPRLSMLAISWIDPYSGVIQPMFDIADFCQKHDITLYVRANDVFGKVFFRFQDLPIDYLSFEGYRMGSIPGIAPLFAKSSKLFRHRKTPLPFAKCVALGIASREILQQMEYQTMESARMTSQFETALSELGGIEFFGKGLNRITGATTFAIDGVHGEALAYRLYKKNILVSVGGGHEARVEDVLISRSVPKQKAAAAVSMRIFPEHSEEMVLEIANTIKEEAAALRGGVHA